MHIMRTAIPWTLASACLVFGACQDTPSSPLATDSPGSVGSEVVPPSAAPLGDAAPRIVGLRDALDRAHSALEPDSRSASVAAGLRQAIAAFEHGDASGVNRALQDIEQTLQRYTPRDNAMAPDLDAIRLAIGAAAAR